MNHQVLIPWLIASMTVLMVLVNVIGVRGEIAALRHRDSRFGLFAARDRLVMLAVEGKIDPSNAGWLSTYRAINSLLDLKHRVDIEQLAVMLFQYMQERDNPSPDVERYHAEIAETAKLCPEFQGALVQMDLAFLSMVFARSPGLMFIRLRILLAVLRLGATGAAGTMKLIRLVIEPSSLRGSTGHVGAFCGHSC